jgi:uncharacterized protein YerC
MNPSLKRQLLRTFVQMVDDLKDKKEIETFLKDFFNDEELEKYVKRLAIAYWLKKGRDEQNISENLKATADEIAMAKKSLKKEGVKLALKKIEAEEWANQWSKKIKRVASNSTSR